MAFRDPVSANWGTFQSVTNITLPSDHHDDVHLGGSFNGVTSMPHWQGSLPLMINFRGDHTLRINANYRDALNAEYEDLNGAQRSVFFHEDGQ